MANQYVSVRNLKFLLHEMLNAPALNRYEYFQDYDAEAFDMALSAAKEVGDKYLFPILREMDKEKAYFKDGVTHTHPDLRKAIKAIADGGWVNAALDFEAGGQQMPYTLLSAATFIFYAANANAGAYPFLTSGAANLIQNFGNQSLKDQYLPDMFNGDWQGTMALTEPQAGSSLTDVIASATPTDEAGRFKIKGQKIYISGGDSTAVDNIIHLTLARIDGAPAGTKGISLFVVPKQRPENGELVDNDVLTAGIYGKMGQKGYTAAHLMMGENDACYGYLVGAEHRGLSYMFQMMNEARIATGLMASGTATAAYYAALQYANERPQGRHPENKDPLAPPVLIIEHADVRRMLLQQKAINEGSLALLLQAAYLDDISKAAEGEEKENAHLLFELLTPICKSYPSEYGNIAVSLGMQVLGGAGYTDDFPLEQYYRDIRVNSIYEGTTTIHGMDLLGRKVMMNKGKAMTLLMGLIQKDLAACMEHDALKTYAEQLGFAGQNLHKTTMALVQVAMEKGPRYFLADATLYLDYFSHIIMGWMWLKQGKTAQAALDAGATGDEATFYQSKMLTMRYFFAYEMPKTKVLHARLKDRDFMTVDMDSAQLV